MCVVFVIVILWVFKMVVVVIFMMILYWDWFLVSVVVKNMWWVFVVSNVVMVFLGLVLVIVWVVGDVNVMYGV